jgi:hypothetical protein
MRPFDGLSQPMRVAASAGFLTTSSPIQMIPMPPPDAAVSEPSITSVINEIDQVMDVLRKAGVVTLSLGCYGLGLA